MRHYLYTILQFVRALFAPQIRRSPSAVVSESAGNGFRATLRSVSSHAFSLLMLLQNLRAVTNQRVDDP